MAVLPQIGCKKSLADLAYEEIREAIVANRFRQGQILAEEELAKELAISRTPVRSALKRLEYEQLIEANSSKNMVVATVTPKDLADATAVRLALEPAAAGLLARSAGESEKAALDSLLEQQRETLRAGRADEFLVLEYRLNTSIAKYTGNRFLYGIVDRIEVFFRRVLILSGSLTVHWGRAAAEHGEVLAAIRANDAPAAESAMRSHIENASSRMNCATAPEPDSEGGNVCDKPLRLSR